MPLHDIFADLVARDGSLLLSANESFKELLLRNWETHEVLLRGRLDATPNGLFVLNGQAVVIVKGKIQVCGPQTGQWLTTKGLKAKHGYVRRDGAFVSLHGDGSVRTWTSLGGGASEPSILETGLKRVHCIAGDEQGFAVLAGSGVHCYGSDGSELWSAPAGPKERVLGVSNDRIAVARKEGVQLLDREDGADVGSPQVGITAVLLAGDVLASLVMIERLNLSESFQARWNRTL